MFRITSRSKLTLREVAPDTVNKYLMFHWLPNADKNIYRFLEQCFQKSVMKRKLITLEHYQEFLAITRVEKFDLFPRQHKLRNI